MESAVCPKHWRSALTLLLSALWLATLPAGAVEPAAPTRASPASPDTLLVGPPPARLAIVIDDLGYLWRNGLRAIALPGPLTVAVLPHTPHAATLAARAHAAGRTVLLHLPMEPSSTSDPGPGALRSTMSRTEFERTLARNLDAVPFISGVNNHMGSRLTAEQEPMDWLMSALQPTGLFFLDSRTTPDSLAAARADAHAVPWRKRDVFLDTLVDEAFVERQLKIAAALAHRRGHAILIGHPHDITLRVLERHLRSDWLQTRNLELVALDQLTAPQSVGADADGPPVPQAFAETSSSD